MVEGKEHKFRGFSVFPILYIGIPKNVYVTESVMTESLKSLVKTFCVSPCGSYKIDQWPFSSRNVLRPGKCFTVINIKRYQRREGTVSVTHN